MKSDVTELVFILDRSGSMGGMESDTIGGFNSMLARQRDEPGECRLTTVLFDDEYEVLHDRIEIKAVRPLTEREYFVRGQTALIDAVGKTINRIYGLRRNTAEDFRAKKVLFVITTDGMENASCEFSYDRVRTMIERRKFRDGWEFLFLGANIDAVEVADRLGIAQNRAQSFHNDSEGIALNYRTLSRIAAKFRAAPKNASLDDAWSEAIRSDYRKRGGKW